MGKALQGKEDQFSYIKNRISMLNDVAQSLESPVDEEELKRIEDMIQSLNQKVERFRQDREEVE